MSNQNEILSLQSILDYCNTVKEIAKGIRSIKQVNNKLCDRFKQTSGFIMFRGKPYTRTELIAKRGEYVSKVQEGKMNLAAIAISIKAQLEPASTDALLQEYCEFPYQYSPVSKVIHEVIVERLGEDEARELIDLFNQIKG